MTYRNARKTSCIDELMYLAFGDAHAAHPDDSEFDELLHLAFDDASAGVCAAATSVTDTAVSNTSSATNAAQRPSVTSGSVDSTMHVAPATDATSMSAAKAASLKCTAAPSAPTPSTPILETVPQAADHIDESLSAPAEETTELLRSA